MFEKIWSLFQNSLIKNSGVYTLSSIVEKSIPFLLLPVLTRYLSTEDYGIVSMFTVMVGITTAFTGLGIKPAVLRSYYKEEIDFPAYVTNALLILITSTTIVAAIYLAFSNVISKYTDFPSDWLLVVVIVSAGQFIINIVLVIWQAQIKPLQYGIFNVLVTALNMGLSILLIVGFGYGWEGRVLSILTSIFTFAIFGIVVLWHQGMIRFQLVSKYIKHALAYGVPLIPHIISGMLITYLDRFFITNMVGISKTGIYTVGYQIGMIIMILASSFNKAWTPWLFEQLDETNNQARKKIVNITYSYFAFIIILAGGLALIAPWFLGFFVGKAFHGAEAYVIWIALGYAFNGMYYMVTGYIFYVEKTKYLAWLTLISAIINIVLNYLLIKIYGAIGAAIATAITFFVLFILAWIVSNRIYKMPWLWFFSYPVYD